MIFSFLIRKYELVFHHHRIAQGRINQASVYEKGEWPALLDSDHLLGFVHIVPQYQFKSGTSMRCRMRSLRTFLYLFIHHSRAQCWGQCFYGIAIGNGEQKGSGVLLDATQVVQKTKFCPRNQGSNRRELPGSAPTFASSASISYMSAFPQNFLAKGYKKSIYGQQIRVPSTTEDFASEVVLSSTSLEQLHRRIVVLTDGTQPSSDGSRVLSWTLTAG